MTKCCVLSRAILTNQPKLKERADGLAPIISSGAGTDRSVYCPAGIGNTYEDVYGRRLVECQLFFVNKEMCFRMSPEALNKKEKYSFPKDIWAVACVLYELW